MRKYEPEDLETAGVGPETSEESEARDRLDGLQRDTGVASDKGDAKAKDLEEKAYGGDDDTPDVPLPG